VPFDEGSLTGKITPETKFEPDDFRNNYFGGDRKQQVYERAQKIVSDLGISMDQMAETALRYVLSHPAVSTVIPGMRSVPKGGITKANESVIERTGESVQLLARPRNPAGATPNAIE
jgi:aldo/keto reductase family protein